MANDNTREYFESIFDETDKGLLFVDKQARIFKANKVFTDMLGLSAKKLISRHFTDIIDRGETLRPLTARNRLHHFIRSEHFPIFVELTNAAGDSVAVKMRSTLCRSPEGDLRLAIGIFSPFNVQSDPAAASERWVLQQHFENILNNTGDAIVICNETGIICTVNEPLLNMLGYSEAELVGRHLIELSPLEGTHAASTGETITIDDSYISRQVAFAEKLFNEGKVTNYELYFIHKNGIVIPVDATISLLRDQNSERRGSLSICRELTGRKLTEQSLTLARDTAEASSKAKLQFMANISHELRTPLNAIMGFCELIMGTDSCEKHHDYAGLIVTESEVLLDLINDLLDIAKVESGRLALETLPFDLDRIMQSIRASFQLRAQRKGLRLDVGIAPDVPLRLKGDPTRLRQIIVNLVSNALKFTGQGSIVVSVTMQEETSDHVILHFEVTDTGIGIPAEKQAVIFESFTQADGSTTRRYGGSGLGTAIAKSLVELMGGTISLSSSPGRGSTFLFAAPFLKRYADKDTIQFLRRHRSGTRPRKSRKQAAYCWLKIISPTGLSPPSTLPTPGMWLMSPKTASTPSTPA